MSDKLRYTRAKCGGRSATGDGDSRFSGVLKTRREFLQRAAAAELTRKLVARLKALRLETGDHYAYTPKVPADEDEPCADALRHRPVVGSRTP
ncbi:MAG: hypothetical protein JWN58_1935 [Gammaproteobacteria bacterium]|jgi:hypothetical protein|nr:hypothetical protein [Gammaproteobacteria bacterium]